MSVVRYSTLFVTIFVIDQWASQCHRHYCFASLSVASSSFVTQVMPAKPKETKGDSKWEKMLIYTPFGMCNRLVNKRSEMELENQSTNNNEYAFKYKPQNVNCAFGKNGLNDTNIYECVRNGKQVIQKPIHFFFEIRNMNDRSHELDSF